MTHEEMMGMIALKDPCADPPAMSFDPANPQELAAGEEAVLEIIGGVPPYTFEILESSLHYIDDSYIAWPPGYSDTYIKATSRRDVNREPWFAADPTLARNGTIEEHEWSSGQNNTTQQRWNIDLGSAKIIRQVMLENSHHLGASTVNGVKNFVLQGSNNANALAQTDYASDEYWTDVETGLQAAQHIAQDFCDPQIFNITNATAYRYYSLKIADCWGSIYYMSLRHIQFHTSQVKVYKIVSTPPQVTIKAPNYALWTAFVKCTDACDQTADTGLYTSQGRWSLQGSTTTGGVPTLCGKENFRIIKNGVMFVGTNCNTNLAGISGDWNCDCSGFGGADETINIQAACGGFDGCLYVNGLWWYCWPYA